MSYLVPCSACDAGPGKTRNILGEVIDCFRCRGAGVMPGGPPCAACGMMHDEPLRPFRAITHDEKSTVNVCRLCWHGESHTIQSMIRRRANYQVTPVPVKPKPLADGRKRRIADEIARATSAYPDVSVRPPPVEIGSQWTTEVWGLNTITDIRVNWCGDTEVKLSKVGWWEAVALRETFDHVAIAGKQVR